MPVPPSLYSLCIVGLPNPRSCSAHSCAVGLLTAKQQRLFRVSWHCKPNAVLLPPKWDAGVGPMLWEGIKGGQELAQREREKRREFNLLLLNGMRVKTSVETSDCILLVAWLSPAPAYRAGIRAVIGSQPAAQNTCVLCA